MKNNRIKDERIAFQRRKIQSDAYQILVYCLLISILIQQFILRSPFEQFAAELFCLIGMGVYMTVRHLSVGIDIWNSRTQTTKKLAVNSVVSGVICIAVLVFLTGQKNVWNFVLFFISFTVVDFLANLMILYINKKRQKQIDDELNINENMDE